MTSPAFRAASTAGASTAANLTITKPTGTVDDDILIGYIAKDDTAAVTAPAGWTLLKEGTANTYYMGIWWKRASSEGANWQWVFSSIWRDGAVLSYSGGVASGSPIDPDPPANIVESASASTLATNANTTATVDTVRVAGYGDKGSTTWTSFQAGYNSRVDFDEMKVIDLALAAAGTTGTPSATNGNPGAFKAYLLEIASLAAGGGGGTTVKQLSALGVG